jgi:spore coat-associated protein N
MDTKILSAIFIIGLVATTAGAGIYAYFSDTETSTGNIFTAGTLDLKVSHSSGGPWTDGVSGTWTLSNMKPGDETPLARVFFKNFGSITHPNTDEHPDEMAKYMTITYILYKNDEVNINCLTGEDDGYPPNENWKVSDTDLDGRITLYDLKQDPLVKLPSPDTVTNEYTQLDMTIKFDENAGSDFQGDIFNLTMIFTLNQ